MQNKKKQIKTTSLYALLITLVLHVLAFLYLNSSSIQTEIIFTPDTAILELDYRETEEIEKLTNPEEPTPDESNQSIKDLMQDIADIRKKSLRNYSESQIQQEVENEVEERNNATLNENKKNESVATQNTISDPNYTDENSAKPKKEASNSFAGKVTRYCNVPGRECYTVAPSYTCKGGGKVQIDIKVDKIGSVKSAKINTANSTTTNECILNQALEYAKRTTKVSSDLKGEFTSSGHIIYNFISQ